jgi:DNA-binding NarL/FixJ family response regulator
MADNISEPKIITVAVVENDTLLCEALKALIDNEPFLSSVGIFKDAETALAALPKINPDVVLMDIDLGENKMNGIECIRQLKASTCTARFMVLTVYEDDNKVFNALSAGALGYVLKSARQQKIVDAIFDIYEGGAPMTPQIALKVVKSFDKINQAPVGEPLLTTREKEIIGLISKGRLEKEVASELFISIKTVKKHIGNIYEKLEVNTRVEALNKYYGR